MVTKVAAPKNTGGGGFVFEDEVCAYLLGCMLAAEPPFEAELGTLEQIEFQTRVAGWLLDDALLTTVRGVDRHRLALSIKSSAQFTAASAPDDFVLNAWQQWLHVDSKVFDRKTDLIGLVTSTGSDASRLSLSSLLTKVYAGDPATFGNRITVAGWANDDERGMFESFACPASLLKDHAAAQHENAALIQRLRFKSFDFCSPLDESTKAALRICSGTLGTSPTDEKTTSLWNELRTIASELRPASGTITRAGLVDRLRGRFDLVGHPDHRADWEQLNEHTRINLERVSNTIAGSVPLQRDALLAEICTALKTHDAVCLSGRSGAGKSAVARSVVEASEQTRHRVLWIDARIFETSDLDTFQRALGLRHSLRELLAAVESLEPVMVIDGLDRIFSERAFGAVGTIIRAARQSAPAARWRVVATSQAQAWGTAADGLRRAGGATLSWNLIEVPTLEGKDLSPVSKAIPELSRLLLQPRVAALMGNLKFLDLVATRVAAGTVIDTDAWIGEANVANWFWEAEIDRGPDRVARGRFARALAERQGDEQITSIPTDAFDPASLATMETLLADRVCEQVAGDRLAFAHDLYGDWARLRMLLNHRADLLAFLRRRQESPLWHRAIRLYGLHQLEHERDLAAWRAALQSVDTEELRVIHDLLLEAPVFAVNPIPLLEEVLPDLLANEGRLLRRLLTRFVAFATLPDEPLINRAINRGINSVAARALFRYPHWPYWLPFLRFLYTHRDVVVDRASFETSATIEMWLRFTRTGDPFRAEASAIGILLGRSAIRMKGYGGRDWHERKQRLYRCALLSAAMYPDEAADIALTAAARRNVEAKINPTPRQRPVSDPDAAFYPVRLSDPWLDGPQARVDDDLQNEVLDSASIVELMRVRPQVACEVILACLIEEPKAINPFGSSSWELSRLHLARSFDWQPPLYTTGPFLACLRVSFDEGLKVIAKLLDFATARQREYDMSDLYERDVRLYGRTAADQRQATLTVEDSLAIEVEGETLTFQGGAHVFGWSSGHGNAPDAVTAALMALEQYFYQELEAKRDVTGLVRTVLQQVRSVAVLHVLIDVGKSEPSLFVGPLRGLLVTPRLYEWDLSLVVAGRSHLMIGAYNHGNSFVELARQFNQLKHRGFDLREVAKLLMFRSKDLREFLDASIASWRVDDSDDDGPDMTAQLRMTLDSSNWEKGTDPERGEIWVNTKLLERQKERAPEHEAHLDRMDQLVFPANCRRLLDERRQLGDDELTALWERWTKLRAHWITEERQEDQPQVPNLRRGSEPADAVAGGIAVFLQHAPWLAADPARHGLVMESLAELIANPPAYGLFDSEGNGATWTWVCFAAEALVAVWLEDLTDYDTRKTLAYVVFANQLVAVEILFRRCAQHRAILGLDFDRLRRLAIEWAYVRDRVELLRTLDPGNSMLDEAARSAAEGEAAAWFEERSDAFANATLAGLPQSWSECDAPNRFRTIDAVRSQWRYVREIDLRVVMRSHAWLVEVTPADDNELISWTTFLRSGLDVALLRPRDCDPDDEHLYPADDERWLLKSAATLLLRLRSDQRPEDLWLPILRLPDHSHDWVQAFIDKIHISALTAVTIPVNYVETVRAIFGDVVARAPKWSSHERIWDCLLGTGDWYELWEPEHFHVVAALVPTFEKWMEIVPPSGRRLHCFARWLVREAARALRIRSLQWFARVLVVDERHEVDDAEESQDAVARLLNIIWSEQEPELRAETSAFASFRSLLRWLVEQQNPLGLELTGRLGGLA